MNGGQGSCTALEMVLRQRALGNCVTNMHGWGTSRSSFQEEMPTPVRHVGMLYPISPERIEEYEEIGCAEQVSELPKY